MKKNNLDDIIVLEHMILKRLKHYPQYHDLFIEKVTASIKQYYAEITSTFAQNLLSIELQGRDPYGFFSIGKDIWIAFEKDSEQIIGFEVITRKRGGSIKLGPTYMMSNVRKRGYATEMIEGLIGIYKSLSFRKVYVTAPLSHASTAVLDYCKLKFSLEAILCKHYAKDSSDRVCGLLFDNEIRCHSALKIRTEYGKGVLTQISIDKEKMFEVSEFSCFIKNNMKDSFSDIDDDFVNSILNGIKNGICSKYEIKGKCVLLGWDNDKLISLSVATLKRGGVIKIVPFLVAEEYINIPNILWILNEIEELAKKNNRRKITLFIPVTDFAITNIISGKGYLSEGVLREPYKKGVDITVFSKFLDSGGSDINEL